MSDKTIRQFDAAFTLCRDTYEKKLQDYGASWRVMRVPSLTDQLYIKAKRIRTLETTGESRVGDGVLTEFVAIVNYGIMALIQLSLPDADRCDLSTEQALTLYDREAEAARSLMIAKNHDYGEAWRDMRQCSFTDIILTKLNRIKEIEGNDGHVTVSEGVGSNYQDIINYAIFAIIKLTDTEA